jgi:hypothetical protein
MIKVLSYIIIFGCLIISFQNILHSQVKDSLKNNSNQLQIDTTKKNLNTGSSTDSVTNFENLYKESNEKDKISNTKLFIYILLTFAGLILFFWIFVKTLFKTLHKTNSTRQALLVSWNSYFVISVIWIFLIWGILAKFWSSETFLIIIVFLFIISIITFLISFKSK